MIAVIRAILERSILHALVPREGLQIRFVRHGQFENSFKLSSLFFAGSSAHLTQLKMTNFAHHKLHYRSDIDCEAKPRATAIVVDVSVSLHTQAVAVPHRTMEL